MSFWWGTDLDEIFGSEGGDESSSAQESLPQVDDQPDADEPPEPHEMPHRTYAAAGSREKIEVLAYRFENNLVLHHPDDGVDDDDAREQALRGINRDPRHVRRGRRFNWSEPDDQEEGL